MRCKFFLDFVLFMLCGWGTKYPSGEQKLLNHCILRNAAPRATISVLIDLETYALICV